MKVVVFATILTLVNCKPNGLYHEEYNYRSSSSSFHNNELQHQKDDEGSYSKHGDLEGRIQPKINAREQHSEYVNPKLKSLGYNSAGSTYGQMQTGQHYENVFQNGMFNHGGGVLQTYPNSGLAVSNYGIQSHLRQISTQVQQQLAQQLQEAIMNQYRQTSAYSNSLTQQQIEADRRILEEELRRNVSLSLQDAIRMRYGTQAVRGGMSYSLVNGRLEPTANYNNQELSDLTRQLENDLIRQLNEGVRSYYHTTTTSHRVTSVKQHQTNNNYNYPTYPSNLQLIPEPQPRPLPLPEPQPRPLPMHFEPTRVDYGPVVPNPDSLTTIATRVQHDLNEHLNKILEDTRQRYFSTHSTQYQQNWDYILQQLENDLRNNVTHQFNLQLHQQPQRFKMEDFENYKRQIETNLITRLNRDFNAQRDNYLRTHTSTTTTNIGGVYGVRPNYYPNVNNYGSGINQEEWANIQRQIHDDLTRQLQVALMRQTHHNYQGNSLDNFNYNTMLQQLTDELNRNLTQQIEYRLRQHYGHNFAVGQQYDTQMAQLRNLLENDLQRQLRQGLQQYSQHYSWSSSSSSSSGASNIKNYRPVRGFETFSMPLNNPDCMMGDDPSVYQQEEQNDDLTQQLEDQDLTQQLEDFDLNQKQSEQLQQLPEKPPKSQKLEDLSDDQQQQEIFPQSPGTYLSRHHHHFSNHLQQQNRPTIRFVKKYYIIDSDGTRKQIDETQFLKHLEISKHLTQDSKDALKFYIGDNFGHNVEILPEQQSDIQTLFHKWFQELLNINSNRQIRKSYYIEDQNGRQKLLNEAEFQEYLQKFRNGNLHMTYKFYQTDNRGFRTEVNPYTLNLIGQTSVSRKYYVIDSDGRRREVNASEYQRLSERPNSIVSSYTNRRYYRIDSQGNRQEIQPGQLNQQNQLTDSELKALEPGFVTKPQSQLGQNIDDSDLTQQTQKPGFGQSIDFTQQIQQNKPHSGKLEQFEFGQEVDDSDLTQQVQQPEFSKPHSGNLQRPEFGQEVDDSDVTQQVQQPDFTKPHSGKLQRPEFGQEVDDSDLTQQVQQPVFNKPQSGNLQRQEQLEFGQQTEDLDLTQQVQQPDFGKPERLQQPQLEFGQQIDDSDLTQQVHQPVFNKPNAGKLLQQPDDEDLTQQVQQPVFNKPQRGRLQRPEFGQEIDDSDLTQQVQQPDFSKPHSGNLQRPEFGQEVDDSDLTQQVQQPIFNKPQRGRLQQPEFGQEIDDSDLTQQVQQPDFSKPHSGKLQRPEFGQEVDDSDLTQQVQQPIFNKPQRGRLQQPEFGQEVEDSDLTQQVQQPDFSKPHSGKLQRPEFGQEVDDLDLTQQVQQPDFSKPHSGNLQKQEQLEFGQQTEDLTQQIQQPDFGKPEKLQQPQLEFGQQVDDSDLTQQVQQPDFSKPQSGKLQRPEFGQEVDDLDLTQQVQQPDFSKPHSGNLQRPEFGQGIDDSDLTQQVQQPNFGKLQQSELEFGQQIDDLTQQVQQPHSSNLQMEFGQQVDNSDLTQQVQQPIFNRPHSGNLQRQDQLELGQQTQQIYRTHYRRPVSGSYHRQQVQTTGNLEFGQEIDDSDLTQQVQQPNFGKIQDIRTNNLENQQVEDNFDQQQSQKQQTFEQPIEPQISNQQNKNQNQRLLEAQQTSQQLIDALRNNLEDSSRHMVYVPRPVYSTLDIDGQQFQVPVGTTRHISQTSSTDAHYKPSTHINLNYQSPYRHPSSGSNSQYTFSTYGRSQSQYSSGANSNQDEQLIGTEIPTEIELTNTANTGIKTKIIDQNNQKQQEIEDNVTEAATTTEAPGFWKRLGSKVKSKAQSIRESIG